MSYSSLNPELVVGDAKKAIEWYCNVFDAKLEFEYAGADGKRLMHSLVRLPSGSTFFVVDDFPEHHGGKSRVRTQDDAAMNNACTTVSVANGEEVFKRAIDSGARVTLNFEKQFWGAVYGRFADPFGHEWAVDQRETAAEVAGVANEDAHGTSTADTVPEEKKKEVGSAHPNGIANSGDDATKEPDAKKHKADVAV